MEELREAFGGQNSPMLSALARGGSGEGGTVEEIAVYGQYSGTIGWRELVHYSVFHIDVRESAEVRTTNSGVPTYCTKWSVQILGVSFLLLLLFRFWSKVIQSGQKRPWVVPNLAQPGYKSSEATLSLS